MKSWLLIFSLLTSFNVFAGNYNINGIQFKSGSIFTTYRSYQGDGTATCEVIVIMNRVSNSASCNQVNSLGVATFAGLSAVSNLLAQVQKEKWSLDEENDGQLSCRIYLRNISGKIDDLCLAADDKGVVERN